MAWQLGRSSHQFVHPFPGEKAAGIDDVLRCLGPGFGGQGYRPVDAVGNDRDPACCTVQRLQSLGRGTRIGNDGRSAVHHGLFQRTLLCLFGCRGGITEHLMRLIDKAQSGHGFYQPGCQFEMTNQ